VTESGLWGERRWPRGVGGRHLRCGGGRGVARGGEREAEVIGMLKAVTKRRIFSKRGRKGKELIKRDARVRYHVSW
jgi:hypothetical protein